MTEIEKSYIAGIVDGEGSIMLIKFHSNEYPSPCVSISSTTLELLNWIKLKVGTGTIITKKNYNIERHLQCYSYVVKYNAALNLIFDIYPYLLVPAKKKRAKLIVSKYKELTPRNGRYSDSLLKLKEAFYEEFIAIKK